MDQPGKSETSVSAVVPAASDAAANASNEALPPGVFLTRSGKSLWIHGPCDCGCGATVTREPRRWKAARYHYATRRCLLRSKKHHVARGASTVLMETRVCSFCGDDITRPARTFNEKLNFCNPQCCGAYNRTNFDSWLHDWRLERSLELAELREDARLLTRLLDVFTPAAPASPAPITTTP